jgi:pSer/pThr/pTyr-binding forkhead associated (FHA) protein/anti-anti-sigma regulatory factor
MVTPLDSLASALGVSRPLRLSVCGSGLSKPQYATIAKPFAIIGRGTGCDILLPERTISFRHVYLQVFGDSVTAIDLLSPTGVTWDGPETNGWLTPAHRLGIGPYQVQLFDDGWSGPSGWPSPLDCKTRVNEPTPYGTLPRVSLELTNRKLQGIAWPINRVLTLLGRDDRCRITCGDERISRVHCSLLLTSSGLWVIDLLGRGGIQVNGELKMCAPLAEGDELTVGEYHMRTLYETELPQEPPPAKLPETSEIPVVPTLTESDLPSPEFLTRTNRIFPVQLLPQVMVVMPVGGIRTASYQDIQLESNIVTQILHTRASLPHVVVDLQQADAIDSIVINAVMAMCRAAAGKSALCGGAGKVVDVLAEMNLTRLWPHFATRDEALRHVLG